MISGMHGLGISGGAKQPGYLFIPFPLRFFGKKQVLAVSLAFSGEGSLQVFISCTHNLLLLVYYPDL
jgi:hypothetical protein